MASLAWQVSKGKPERSIASPYDRGTIFGCGACSIWKEDLVDTACAGTGWSSRFTTYKS